MFRPWWCTTLGFPSMSHHLVSWCIYYTKQDLSYDKGILYPNDIVLGVKISFVLFVPLVVVYLVSAVSFHKWLGILLIMIRIELFGYRILD